jgi:alpha-1,2-mannosyltransferase
MAEAGEEQSASTDSSTNYIYVAILVISLAALPASGWLIPRAIGIVGRIIGFFLRRKTAGRRAQIVERAEEASRSIEAKEKRDSDEWEHVESYLQDTVGNGEKGAKDWDGIVGFFHPFWYSFTVLPLGYPNPNTD